MSPACLKVNKWFLLLVIFTLGILQVTVFDYFKIFGIKPDLFLICVIALSLELELKWAFFFSLLAGSLKDIFSTGSPGINTLLFASWNFVIIRLSRNVTLDNALVRVILVWIIAILHNLIIRVIYLFSGRAVPLGVFLRITFVGSFYTALVSPLVFKILKLDTRYK